MAHRNPKKLHPCKNHRKKTARGRCTACKKWICRDCSVYYKGRFFCRDTCSPKGAFSKPADAKKACTGIFSRLTLKHAVIWGALTIGLGGVVFGLIQVRENLKLAEQIDVFKENRAQMIELLKQREIMLTKVKEKIGQMQDTATKTTDKQPEKSRKTSVDAAREYTFFPGTVPLSFDNGATSKKLIALTFDGASHINAAAAILDTLRSRNVTTTMFLTGGFIRKHPDLVRKIIANGHEVGNHTNTHPHLTAWATDRSHTTLPEISTEVIRGELTKTNESFRDLTGTDMLPLWRAPYGEKNDQICRWAQQHGYLHIGWKQARSWRENFDTNDWIPDPETPGYHTLDETLQKFNELADAQPLGMNGAIILMHLGTIRKEGDEQVHHILGKIIDMLRQKGYELAPVSVLIKEAGVDISLLKRTGEAGLKYFNDGAEDE